MADDAWLKLHEFAGYVKNDLCGSLKKIYGIHIFDVILLKFELHLLLCSLSEPCSSKKGSSRRKEHIETGLR